MPACFETNRFRAIVSPKLELQGCNGAGTAGQGAVIEIGIISANMANLAFNFLICGDDKDHGSSSPVHEESPRADSYGSRWYGITLVN
jgi:hypothetical protein